MFSNSTTPKKFSFLPHLIFDFDGTIADSLPIITSIVKQLISEAGLKHLYSWNLATIRELSLTEILSQLGISVVKLPIFFRRGRQLFREKMPFVRPFPQIKTLLYFLSGCGFPLGILSSNSEKNIRSFLHRHQLDLFQFVATESNFFGKKRALQKLLCRLRLDSTKAIYVGDEIRDVEACLALKVPIIAVSWGLNSANALKKANPTAVVSSPAELEKKIFYLTQKINSHKS